MGTQAEFLTDIKLATEKIEELKAENHNLKCQIRILTEKNEDLWYQNKLQMSKIVEYRRKLEHYEDGAPMYVPRDV